MYFKKMKSKQLSIVTNYTRSHIDFNKGEAPIENTFYNAFVLMKGQKLNLSVNVYRNQSLPKVDSLNYSGCRLEVSQDAKKKVYLSSSLFLDKYDSEAYRYNWVNSVNTTFLKKIQMQASIGIGRIEGLYGIDKKDVFSGQIIMRYRL